MNIAFFGSPSIAADLLKGLLAENNFDSKIELVATQPDRPAGKKLELQETEVKQLAKQHNLTIFDKQIKDSLTDLENILKTKGIELCVVYAYGGYIPSSILQIPKYGFINIHPSLLPSYRGPSPIAYPLILGDKETGTTIIQLNEDLDGGDIISQEKTTILENETRPELEKRLTELGLTLTIDFINNLENNIMKPVKKQKAQNITNTRLLSKNDGYLRLSLLQKALSNDEVTAEELPDIIGSYYEKYPHLKRNTFKNSAQLVYNLYKGLYGWPGIWTKIDTPQSERRLKINKLTFEAKILKIMYVQLEGKNEVDFRTFNKAYSIF